MPIENYSNYHFYENFFLEVDIPQGNSFATSPDQLPDVVKRDIAATEIKNCLQLNASNSPYEKYNKLIFSPEEVYVANPEQPYDAGFATVREEIVVKVDLLNVSEPALGNGVNFFGKARCTIDVFALRKWLESRNEISCNNGSIYNENGCAHFVPETATHVTFGAPDPDNYETNLKNIFGQETNVPSYERITPYIDAEDSTVSSFDITKIQSYKENGHNTYLPAGTYLEVQSNADPTGMGLKLAKVLSGATELVGKEIYVSQAFLKLVTWGDTGLNKEQVALKEQLGKVIDRPLNDEPSVAADLFKIYGATHVVRRHINPAFSAPLSTRLYKNPSKDSSVVANLSKDTCVKVIEQSIGKNLFFHKVQVTDLSAGQNHSKEGYVFAPDLRPIRAAYLLGAWHYLPLANIPDNKNLAGSSALLEKPWETLNSFDGPWLKKDSNSYWNDMYQVVVVEHLPSEDPRLRPGDKSFIKQFAEPHKIKGVTALIEYFDKKQTANVMGHILALAKFGAKHEGSEYRKGTFKSLISVPARFFEAFPRNTDDFTFDYEPDLEKRREGAELLLTLDAMADEPDLDTLINKAVSKDFSKSNPTYFKKQIKKYAGLFGPAAHAKNLKELQSLKAKYNSAVAKVISGRIKLNPSVEGERLAFTTGLYLTDLENNVKQVQDILKFYDKKIKSSKKKITFPGFSAPLDVEEEKKNLSKWMGALKEMFQINSVDFSEKSPEEKNVPAKNDPSKSWIELGWNQEFEIMYILFNGHPLRIGFNLFKLREPGSLARTNALVHRSPEIVKDFPKRASKRAPWSEWVKENIYPIAIIEPSNESQALPNKNKIKKEEAVEKSKKTTAKTEKEVAEEEESINNVDINLQIQKEAIKEKIDANDAVFKEIEEVLKTVKDIEEMYDLVFNKLPFESIAMEFLRCIGQDLDADGLIELLLRLGLQQIVKNAADAGLSEEEVDKNVEDAFKTLDEVLEILMIAKDCALDILESGFEIVVEKPDIDEDMSDLVLPNWEGPSPASGPEEDTSQAAAENNNITHIVKQGAEESYSSPLNAKDKKVTFWKTLPWEPDPGTTGYSPSGGSAHGRIEYGTAVIKMEEIPAASPNDPDFYGDTATLPDLGSIFSSSYFKVKTVDTISNLPPGTTGYLSVDVLESVDDAVAAALKEESMTVLLKKPSRDGKNGLTNEVKALQSYMGAPVPEAQKTNEDGEAGTYVAGKFSGKFLIQSLDGTPGFVGISKLLTTEITNLDGIFATRMDKLTKALGAAFVKEYEKLPDNASKQPLIDRDSAELMASKGHVTVAAMDKIKSIFMLKISTSKEKQRLEEIKKSLSFRSPSVVLGTVLFAPPGFYEGKDSVCGNKFIILADQQTKYEATLISSGADSDEALKEKLKLEILFEEYRACMSAQGTNVYGNYISHLFGRDISPEDQKKKDGYKIVFAEGTEEGSSCADLEDALIASLGGSDEWPGSIAATDDQQNAYDAWLACVHKTASEQIAKQKQAEIDSLKNNVIQMHVSSRHPVPTTFEEVYDLFVNKKVGLGGIPSLKLKPNAGVAIADAILYIGRPCSNLRDTLVDLLIAYILEKYPEIELTVRYTLLAYKKSFELYALVRNQMQRSTPFGLPKFPKLPTDSRDQNLTKNFEEALDRVLNEALYTMLRDLVVSLAEICKVINEDAADPVSPETIAGNIIDNLENNPSSGQIAKEVFDQLGIDVFPPEINNKHIIRQEHYSTFESRPTIYAFLLSVIDGLDKADICSIINRSTSSTLLQSVKETVLATFPEHREVIVKDSTIYAVFDMIAEIMPADFCDVIFTPPENTGFTCLADLIEHNQKQRFKMDGLPEKDVEELVEIRKTRNMKRMVEVAGMINDPQGTMKSATPNMCDTVKEELLAEPGFMSAMSETVNSQLNMIKTTFNNDITSFKPMILRTQEDLQMHASASAFASAPFGIFASENASADQGSQQTPPSNLNLDLLIADPEGMMLGMLEAAAQSEQPDAYAEQVDKYAEYLETSPRHGIFIPSKKQFMTYGQLFNIGFKWNTSEKKSHYGSALNYVWKEPLTEASWIADAVDPFRTTAADADDATGGYPGMGNNHPAPLGMQLLKAAFEDIDKPNKIIKANSENLLERLMSFWLQIKENDTGLFTSHADVLNDDRLTPTNFEDLEVVEFQVPIKKPVYNGVASENSAIAKEKNVMGNFKNSLFNPDQENLLTRPAVGSSAGANKDFKFTLNTMKTSGNGIYGDRQFSLVEVEFPDASDINNSFNVSVMTTPPKLQLDGPVLVKNEFGFLQPAQPPPSIVLAGGDKTSYNSSSEMPLYATNFVDLLKDYIPHDSSETGQTKGFIAFMTYIFEKHFPTMIGQHNDYSSFVRSEFTDDSFRSIYISMINSIFESCFRGIASSKYFLEDEISKLNLTPGLKERALCDKQEVNPSLHLLGISNMRSFISNAFKSDFNPCETQKQGAEPEFLEQAISEACVMLFIRTIILETVLNGIHSYGTFDINDLTDDIFVRKYMFDKCKKSLRRLKQYKAFKETALKVLDRKRKQDKEVIPLMNGADSLLYLFKRETKIMSPVYETMLGSKFKNFDDILFDNIVFPVPVNMHSYLTPTWEIKDTEPFNLFTSTKRLDREVGESANSGLGNANIKKYFGLSSPDAPSASTTSLGSIEVSPGVKIPIEDLGELTFEEIFSNKPGFILERFMKLTLGTEYGSLVEKIKEINEAYGNKLSSSYTGIIYTPPSGPYISMVDFFIWIKSIENFKSKLASSQNEDAKEYRAFLSNLLNSSWDQYYSNISFGLRIKYLLPTDNNIDASSFPGMNNEIDYFKAGLGNFVEMHQDFSFQSPLPMLLKDSPTASESETRNEHFMKSSRVAFQSKNPTGDKLLYEIPLVEDTVTVKLGSNNPITSLSAFSTMVESAGDIEKLYDIFFLPRLKTKLKNNNMVKSIFDFMIPTKKIVNACSVYTRELLETQYNTSTLFNSTKFAIASLHGAAANKNMAGWPTAGALSTGNLDIDQEELSLQDNINEIITGFIIKALLTAPPLIVKGVCEAADPNIMITKRIFDGVDMTVMTAMSFMVDAFESARQEYMIAAKEANQAAKNLAAEDGREILPSELPMPEYDSVREFMAFGLGINPPIDPTVGIPKAVAAGMAPAIALAMMPSMLPFGVGFPPPPFGPGLGPPLTPFAIPYLAMGLIKEGGILEGLGIDGELSRGHRSICGDVISRKSDPKYDLEEDDDPSVLDYLTDPGNQPAGPVDYEDIDII
jgi:hypothetical protein